VLSPPIRLFIIGVLVAEALQFAFWLRKNAGKSWHGYLTDQAGVLVANMGVNVAVCLLWSYEGLDAALAWLASFVPGTGEWATSGVPYTPPVGLLLGVASDFFGDDVAYNLVGFAKARIDGILAAIGGRGAPPGPPAPQGG